ncbi:MAG: 3-deoxy-manno-octulosonate cytidylyltransferase [Flavobacteriales bacterium]|jgi:3-deoxy-manno-octulosonate cytidylyltransferase (CMP-KDO synthetase)|nr:3-deoxy-manno-octulosonate cytidylyltransferase [Flavobacteriales bacterium]MBT4881203.1 3-deoxy-manno-octulosonate cytidylyltransferase [Flavobacteriales bacterium]MDG1348893.1 3-deoxy-manno-octulosonate cytidylyltransferase [Flavobacteriales bacterium]
MKIIGIIPARYGSSRFPGKPLVDILGKSMIQRVYEQCKKASSLTNIIVATDDERIFNHVIEFGGKVIMTSSSHPSGTDRCNEVVQKLEEHYDIAINIQGDEPYINPEQIDQVANLFSTKEVSIATLVKKIEDKSLISDINSPKAIFDSNGIAQNFCREITNFSTKKTYFKHIGIYGYRTKTLSEICKLPPSKNEINERLEQLRWLDNNYLIKVGVTTHEGISVDTPEDIEKIKAQMG